MKDLKNKMKYIILLRGINISGKNKISMTTLKQVLEINNYQEVFTYLNSGNIILNTNKDKIEITYEIHKIIKENFNLEIPVYVITYENLQEVYANLPSFCLRNTKEYYSNIIFIIDPLKSNDVVKEIGNVTDDIDTIKEYKNIIYWSYDLKKYQKSNWWKKTASIDFKDFLTIRTINTIKNILELCKNKK